MESRGPWGQPRQPGQENMGKAWSTDDENQLIRMLAEGASSDTCATEFKRSIGGIRSRQYELAYRFVEDGKTLSEACQIMKVNEEMLAKSIRSRTASKEARLNKKKDTSTQMTTIVNNVQPNTELSLLVEIRDLLKLLVASNPSTPSPVTHASASEARRSVRVE